MFKKQTFLLSSTLIMVGKVLLGTDLILASLVYAGLRSASYLFLWLLVEGMLRLALMGVGLHEIADARRALTELTSRYFHPSELTASHTR
jgi:hypothetical protein